MSVGIVHDENGAVLYCTTSDWAFGPVFASAEHAENFLQWLRKHPHPNAVIALFSSQAKGTDPREFTQSDLAEVVGEWRASNCDSEGRLKDHNG